MVSRCMQIRLCLGCFELYMKLYNALFVDKGIVCKGKNEE